MVLRKTAIVTGGNSGIGFETAKALVGLGWRVVVTGRDEARLRAAVAELARAGSGEAAWRVGDFASLAAVRRLAAALAEEERLDVLINNAGLVLSRQQGTEDGNDAMVQINHLAPFLLTNLLLPKLRAAAPARIVNVASRAHRAARGYGFDDFQMRRGYGPLRAYARTKLYNILFTRALARRLAGSGVTANALHPGGIRTRIAQDGDLGGLAGLVYRLLRRTMDPPETGAVAPLRLATAPELATVSGRYFGRDGREAEPTALARDEVAAERLWEISAALVGLGR
ncbi:MAG: SDR family NAD(P)-dependent oxidoreductase [Rhodospirillaceae bacterium]|nr:SDR family NAD(P)-dependent oxidoreductase [Rhodospirillaceae bacterium]